MFEKKFEDKAHFLFKISGRFKSKETDFVGFITIIHISRQVNQIFMFFMSKN